jgi:WD40 repeat protein
MYQYFHRIARAHAGWRNGEMSGVERLLEDCPVDQRRWEWHCLKRLCHAELTTLKGHTDWVLSVAYNPDGKQLASGSVDQTVKIWDATTGQEIRTLRGHTGAVWSLAYSPDGKRLASASADTTVKVWDATTGREILTFKGHTNPAGPVAFSPDGKCIASGDDHAMVKVWDATTLQELDSLEGDAGWVSSVAFSPDGKRLTISWLKDGTVSVWEVLTQRPHRPAPKCGDQSGRGSPRFSRQRRDREDLGRDNRPGNRQPSGPYQSDD